MHWVCSNSACTQDDMANARGPQQTTYWQIYVMRDLATTEREVKRAVALGFKGFALTVDAIRAGKRERDLRTRIFQSEDDEVDNNEDGCEDGDDQSFEKEPAVKRA